MQRPRRIALATGAAMLAGTALAGTAAAEPIDNRTYHNEFTETVDDLCGVTGLTARHDVTVEGRLVVNTHGPDGLPYFLDRAEVSEVYTILATGERFTIEVTGISKDLAVTDNGDGTTTIQVLQTGNQVLYGPDGTALARNPGQVRFEFLVDNGGTPTDPSDDQFLEFLGDVKDPTGRNDDFCAGAADL